MGEGLNKPLFFQTCMSTDVLYFSFWRERVARGLADVFEKTEKKNKTTSAYRLLELPPLLLIDI